MDCPACGQTNAEGAIACGGCEAPLQVARWPEGVRCTAVISFDVDGPTPLINRDPGVLSKPSTLSMGHYGPAVAMPRILELLRRYEAPASFFFPGWIAERYPRVVERVVEEGHEAGHHGYLHEPPATLRREEEAAVLDRTSGILRGITGSAPAGYRSPAWELSEHSLELLGARGFRYDSSLMGHDLPYLVGDPAAALAELPVHWSLDDFPYFFWAPSDARRLQASPSQVLEVWRAGFDEIYDRGGLYMLTMHPFIIGRPSRLGVLERLLEHIQSRPGVRFARAVDVADAMRTDGGTRPVDAEGR